MPVREDLRQQRRQTGSRRLVWLTVILGVFALIIAGRLIQLQVIRGAELGEQAHSQQVSREPLPGLRGSIYDRNGVVLAADREIPTAFLSPAEVPEERRDYVIDELSRILGLPRTKVYELVHRGGYFVWLSRGLSEGEAADLREAALPGVHLRDEPARIYPLGRTAAHLLGFVGVDHRGLEGLELLYDDELVGEPGWVLKVTDAAGRPLYPLEETLEEPERGRDIFLTIDARYQHIVERELAAAVERGNARGGMAVMLDPADGSLLALANYPDYDPNDFAAYPAEVRRNRAVTDVYEPGSTMKAFTVAAALEEGLVEAETVFDTPQATLVTGRRIRDSLPHDPRLTVSGIIERSSNVGVLQIGRLLGREHLHDYLRAFGFGEPSGLEVVGEAGGILRDAERWYPLDTACASFGQGIAVTPLQLAVAYAALANGGNLVRPRLVERFEERGRPVADNPSEPRGRVISAETAAELREILVDTVERGLAVDAGGSGYRVGGKTGTAQKIGPGGYLDGNRYIASFVGFAPAADPRLVLLVVLDEPRPIYGGGPTCGPAFARIVRQVLALEGVPAPGALSARVVRADTPDLLRRSAPVDGELELLGLDARRAAALISAAGLRAEFHGCGTVSAVEPDEDKLIVHLEDR
jgi:cell division protein FtsI (penicillin-binding protein 3)